MTEKRRTKGFKAWWTVNGTFSISMMATLNKSVYFIGLNNTHCQWYFSGDIYLVMYQDENKKQSR